MRIPCPENIKDIVVSNIKNKLIREAEEAITIDGIRAEFSDGWVLVRKSGTEPVISVRAEAKKSNKLGYYQNYIEDLVNLEIEEMSKRNK